MASTKMNVLVYSGNGSTVETVKHCLYTLRRLLSPNYAVIPVTASVILKEPWTASCALLVFPGGRDLGYCQSLNGEGNRRISQYVRRGGAYMGFCAGGYYGSSRCEFEVGNKPLEVIGPRELSFFPGVCRGGAFKGFVYHSEAGTSAAALNVDPESFESGLVPLTFRSYCNGGGAFVDASKFKDQGVEILATYSEPLDIASGEEAAALIYCKVGEGGAILTGTHPEFAASNLDPNVEVPRYANIVRALSEDDDARSQFLKACLLKLGLRVSEEMSSVPSLSRLHLSSTDHHLIPELLESWNDIVTKEDGEEYIKGENDTFHIKLDSSNMSLEPLIESLAASKLSSEEVQSLYKVVDYNTITKNLTFQDAKWPDAKETPYFNHFAYYSNLRKYQEECLSKEREFGNYLMYGEVVTSTSTTLEKNSKLLSLLPHGFAFTATTQVAGRGRGSNVWISPRGCLIFSVVLKHPMQLGNKAPVVFVQYLAAIAIVEAIHSYDQGYQNVPVKLKWPNDIYALDPTKPSQKEYVKIGGILVTSSFSSGNYDLVVGIGINTNNPAPSTCLNSLLSSLPDSDRRPAPFTPEKLLARILTKFEDIYVRFCRTGFDSTLEKMYYDHWLHKDQIVTLEEEGGVRARIKGITRDWGLLVAEQLDGERLTRKVYELQSDCNSFDFFKGLVKKKV